MLLSGCFAGVTPVLQQVEERLVLALGLHEGVRAPRSPGVRPVCLLRLSLYYYSLTRNFWDIPYGHENPTP